MSEKVVGMREKHLLFGLTLEDLVKEEGFCFEMLDWVNCCRVSN